MIRQRDDKLLHWRAEIAGKTEEWVAEIIEQVPDPRIMWRSTSGITNAGLCPLLRFHPDTMRVKVEMGVNRRFD